MGRVPGRGVALVVTAALVLQAGAAVGLGGEPLDTDLDGIDDALEQALGELYAPVLFIEPGEENYPTNVDWILQGAELWYHEDCTSDVQERVPMAFPVETQTRLLDATSGRPWRHPDDFGRGHDENGWGGHCGDYPDHRRITTRAADPDGEGSTGYSDQTTFYIPNLPAGDRVGSLDPRDWVTYLHAYPTARGGIMLQYWHTFVYNDFPLDDHGGDWDAAIQVELDEQLELLGVWFSRHTDDAPGTFMSAEPTDPRYQLTLVDGTHAVVAIDGGGHAAFASPIDWCTDPYTWGGVRLSDIAWTTTPTDPASLRTIACDRAAGVLTGFRYTGERGGTIWQTWTGGRVLQGGADVAIRLRTASGGHGGLVNVGEHNPCTRGTCIGARQASTLLAGRFLPLNGQTFIAYAGRWGDIGLPLDGPRGPVFQGFKDGVYTSWYNQGADAPADARPTPWRVAPSVSLAIGPLATVGGLDFAPATATGTITVTQSAIAARFGRPRTEYRVVPLPGSGAPAYGPYVAPFAIGGPDGAKSIQVKAFDALNNVARTFADVIIDATPPTTTATLTPAVPDGARGWYRQDVSVRLDASDPRPASGANASGVIGTWYRVNGGAWRSYAGPFSVASERPDVLVESYSVDAVGNREQLPLQLPPTDLLARTTATPGMLRFGLDKSRPRITLLGGQLGGERWSAQRLTIGATTHEESLTVDCEVSDNLALEEVRAVASGPRAPTEADGGIVYATQALAGSPAPRASDCSLRIRLRPGRNAISLVVEDGAGWTGATPILLVYEPAAPQPTLLATPEPTHQPTMHPTPKPTPHATPQPTPHATPKPTPKPTPHATPKPANISVEADADRVCGDFESHIVRVSWHVAGGEAPIHVTLRLTLPDGAVERREDDGRTGSAKVAAEAREGGSVSIKVRTEDATGASAVAVRDLHLAACH